MWSNNTLLIELVPNDRIHYDIEYWPKQVIVDAQVPVTETAVA